MITQPETNIEYTRRTEEFKVHLQTFLTAAVLMLLIGVFSCSYIVFNRSQNTVKLQIQINPNTAPACSLARLPGIGIVRAWQIINYRGNHSPAPFNSCEDLQKVEGIGPAISDNICKYLRFD